VWLEASSEGVRALNSILNPAVPAGAFDEFLVHALPAARRASG
jgi:hypothetical protein